MGGDGLGGDGLGGGGLGGWAGIGGGLGDAGAKPPNTYTTLLLLPLQDVPVAPKQTLPGLYIQVPLAKPAVTVPTYPHPAVERVPNPVAKSELPRVAKYPNMMP